MNDHNAPSNRIQLKPLPPIIRGGSHNSSQSNLSLPKQQTEPAESLGRFIESPIKKEEKEQESILDFQDPLAVSPGTESIVKVVEDGEEDKMEHLIKIMDVIEESEGLEEVKAEIQRMLEGDEDYDIINGENSNGFSMKNLANYYKDINEKMEIRIAESIKQIKKAIQENKDMAEKTTKESEFLEEQIQQATKQVNFF